MSACLSIDVADIARTLRHFDAIKVYRADAATGTYLEVSTPTTRPVLVAGQDTYTFEDQAGTAASYYVTSYWNSQTRVESSQSSPVQADSGGSAPLVTVDTVKNNYLFGLPLRDRQGNPLPNAVFETGIRTATAWIERRLGLQLQQVEVVDEHHDTRLTTSAVLPLCTVDKLPIQKVRSLAVRLPGRTSDPYTIPVDAIEFDSFEGRLELRVSSGGWPWAGSRYAQNRVGWLQANVAMHGSIRSPGAVRVSYLAGFAPGQLPADIADLLAKAATLHPLAIAGDLAGPIGIGSSSISIDGLGQSIGRIANQQGNAFASRMSAYSTQIEAEVARLRSFYRGTMLRVV